MMISIAKEKQMEPERNKWNKIETDRNRYGQMEKKIETERNMESVGKIER